jgi:hypothetical protein
MSVEYFGQVEQAMVAGVNKIKVVDVSLLWPRCRVNAR